MPHSFPYSKDSKKILCETIPMWVDRVEEFQVTESDDMRVKSDIKSFIEYNPEYYWLDTLPLEAVIYGYGKGNTKLKSFTNFSMVK